MTKKANTDPTFPAPPANAPNTGAAAEESIDDMLQDLGKVPEPGKKKRRAVPEPSEAAAAEPHLPAPRAQHETIPNANVIVREPTEPGLGNELKVTPEERARLDALMKAHAKAHNERDKQEYLEPGDRNADTNPGRVIDKPPPVTTDASKAVPRKPVWPVVVGALVVAAVIAVVLMNASTKSSTSSAATTTTTTATTTATTTTTATAPSTEVAPLPTIATTSVENLPTAATATAAHPVTTGRPVQSSTTAPSARPTTTATAASPTSTQPPPPGMHLLPDDPHK